MRDYVRIDTFVIGKILEGVLVREYYE